MQTNNLTCNHFVILYSISFHICVGSILATIWLQKLVVFIRDGPY